MPVYSHSRLSAFEKCPLQYKYRYIDRIPCETEGIEAFLGKRVHEVLEKLYRDVLMSKHPSLDGLVALYHRNWDARFSDKVTIVKAEYTADHYRGLGERCLVDYYHRYEPFDQSTTLGLEDRIAVVLDEGGRYQLQGYIDRLARAGSGVYEIHDYKTSSSLPSDESLRRDRQLTLYQMAVEKRFPDAREVRLIWHYLVFDQELTSRRTPEEVERHRGSIMGLIDTIGATQEFPPRESALCRWCEYRSICPVQKHLVKIEALPGKAGLDDDGVRLVDRLAALRAQRKKTDREIAEVEGAILAFAQREGVTAVRGSAHQARLRGGGGDQSEVTLTLSAAEQIPLFE